MKKIILSVLLTTSVFLSYSQTEDWIRVFGGAETNFSQDLIETYDKGYILLVNTYPGGYPTLSWIIKTDINGELLWEKKIGDGSTIVGFEDIHQTEDGGYILAGSNWMIDNQHGDTFFMKLNTCGEKEWCKIFHNSTQFDSGANIYSIPGEDTYIALVADFGQPGPGSAKKGIWLFKLNYNGEIIWMKNIFDQVHPLAWNELPKHMFLNDDGELIIYGFTLYGLPEGYKKPFVVSASTDSTENWWAIIAQNQDLRGEVKHAVEDFSGDIYATGWFDDYDPETHHIGIHKLDKFGNIIYEKYIIDSTEQAGTYCINLLNDSTLDVAGVWFYPDQPAYNTIVRLDSNGNVLFEKQILQSDYSFSNTLETFDGKDLYVGSFKDGNFFKIQLHKFNSDLEYDSIYTQPFNYDYMCDDLPIVSDTIDIYDCAVWTSLPGEIEYRLAQYLVVYPNPATEKITIQLPKAIVEEKPWGSFTSRHFNHQYYNNSVLCIYDIFGRQVKETSLHLQQESELEINISAFPQGIYLINLYENNKKMASGKFIKTH
ncbi:MAG: T9SS type A sorting domain-containing protein [Cyclobacteriaceae bacterium]